MINEPPAGRASAASSPATESIDARGVGEVDDHAERLPAIDDLHPTRHPGEVDQALDHPPGVQRPPVREPERRRDVVGVVAAGHRHLEGQGGWAPELDVHGRPRRVAANLRDPKLGVRGGAVRDDPRSRGTRGLGEHRPVPVVGIDDRDARPSVLCPRRETLEQAALRVAVRLERPVEVEVLVGQVGEDRGVVVDAADPVRREPVAAGLDDDRLLARIDHLAEDPLQLQRARRGVGLHVRPQLAADLDPDRADQTRWDPASAQHRPGEERGGRLAVGAGDADREQLAAWVAVPPGRRGGEGRRSLLHDELRHRQVADRLLHGHRSGAALDGLAHEVVPVDAEPANGHEQVTGLDRS